MDTTNWESCLLPSAFHSNTMPAYSCPEEAALSMSQPIGVTTEYNWLLHDECMANHPHCSSRCQIEEELCFKHHSKTRKES